MDIVRLIIAVVTGVVAGSAVNMGLILLGPSIIPPPAGVDMSTTQGMQAGIHLLTAKHFVFPFLAHALGTFTGALVTYLISRKYRNRAAWGMGLFFLAGGVVAANLIPAPGWFIATDLALAYLPMAWLAILLGDKLTNHPASTASQILPRDPEAPPPSAITQTASGNVTFTLSSPEASTCACSTSSSANSSPTATRRAR